MLRVAIHSRTRVSLARVFSTTTLLHPPKKPAGTTPAAGAARARRQKARAPLSSDTRTGKRTPAAAAAAAAPPNLERLTSSRAPKTAASSASASAPPKAQSAADTTPAPMRGRFNRITADKGLSFATYLYVLGEAMTLGLTCLLHFNLLGVGDVGLWLGYLGVPVDTYLNIGPTVFGLQLSPRLLLNYAVANACCYPLYRFQYAFCTATAPVFTALFRPMRQMLQARKEKANTIPKAPSSKPT